MKEPMDEPKVSVIMAVYNVFDEEELSRAIDSIMGQSLSDIEFIICDDGSSDEAYGILKKVTEKYAGFGGAIMDRRLRVIREEVHRGIAHALNRCIDEAKGRFIARMDADDEAMPDRLLRQYEAMVGDRDIPFCGCGAYLTDEAGKIWGKRVMPAAPMRDDYLRFSPYIHPTVMFRRSVFEHDRYSEERVTLQCEDYDLFLRLYLKGEIGTNLEDILYRYREDEMSYKRRGLLRRYREMIVRNRYFKRMDVPEIKRLMYTVRPMVGGVIPKALMRRAIMHRDGWRDEH